MNQSSPRRLRRDGAGCDSALSDGGLNGYQSYRGHIWGDTDPDRCGVPEFLFRDDAGFDPQEFLPGRPSRGLLRIVWRRKALTALGAVVGLALAALFYAQQSPVYEATAQVMVIM